jgi:uncharacterized protein YqgC (DUF456 family)
MSDTELTVVVGLAMAIGLVGTLFPILPGLLLIWAAALVYGLVGEFGGVGIAAMFVITALTVAGVAAGVVIPKKAAGTAGASKSSLLLGAVVAVIGFFVIPIVGVPIGGALGIFVGEQIRTGDHRVAWIATKATLTGFGLAALAQFAAGVLMVITWVVWAVAG